MSAEVPEKVLFVCKTTVIAFLQVLCPRAGLLTFKFRQTLHEQSIAPEAARRWQFDSGKNRGGSTSVRGRVRISLVAGGG